MMLVLLAILFLFTILPFVVLGAVTGKLAFISVLPVISLNFSFVAFPGVVAGTVRGAILIWAPIVFVSMFFFCYFFDYGAMPSPLNVLAFLNSNPREICEFVSLSWWLFFRSVLLSFGFFLACKAVMFRCISVEERQNLSRKKLILFFLLMGAVSGNFLVWMATYSVERTSSQRFAIKNSFPLGFLTSFHAAYWDESLQLDNQGHRFFSRKLLSDSGVEVYVLVIGESASARYWMVGDYDRSITDSVNGLVKKGEAIYFGKTIAQAGVTAISVPMLITAATPEEFWRAGKEKSILTAFEEAGFATYWISNQDEFPHTSEAQRAVILNEDWNLTQGRYDEGVLPFLDDALAESGKKKFIVLHLMGSHVKYDRRVPPGFDCNGYWREDNLDSQYRRTICYTDHVLGLIVDKINKVHGKSFVWYVSDHGQTVRDGMVGHGGEGFNIHEKHVPMFVWFNDGYRKSRSQNVSMLRSRSGLMVSQGVTFPTVLSLAGLTYPGLDGKRNFAGIDYESPLQFPFYRGAIEASLIEKELRNESLR